MLAFQSANVINNITARLSGSDRVKEDLELLTVIPHQIYNNHAQMCISDRSRPFAIETPFNSQLRNLSAEKLGGDYLRSRVPERIALIFASVSR